MSTPMLILNEPIILGAGATLSDQTFVVSTDDFHNSSRNALIYVNGDSVTIERVRIVGYPQRLSIWDETAPTDPNIIGAMGSHVSGIRVHPGMRDLAVRDCSIEGLPNAGVFAAGMTGSVFSGLRISHCFVGMAFAPPNSVNTGIELHRCVSSDTWGTAGIGGMCFALFGLRDSTLTDCVAYGDVYGGFKLSNPQQVAMRGCRGVNLQVQGIASGSSNVTQEPARDVLIEDCVFDKGLGHTNPNLAQLCGVQFTYKVAQARMHRCIVNGADQGGHAIQFSDSHGTVECCVIRDWNGWRGSEPAVALSITNGGSANTDFERVNSFVDQQRIRS